MAVLSAPPLATDKYTTTTFAEDKILKLAFSEESMVGDLTTAPIKDKDRYIIAIVCNDL